MLLKFYFSIQIDSTFQTSKNKTTPLILRHFVLKHLFTVFFITFPPNSSRKCSSYRRQSQKWKIFMVKLTNTLSRVIIFQLLPHHALSLSTDYFFPLQVSNHWEHKTVSLQHFDHLPVQWPSLGQQVDNQEGDHRPVKSQWGKELCEGWKRDLNWIVRRGTAGCSMCSITISQ